MVTRVKEKYLDICNTTNNTNRTIRTHTQNENQNETEQLKLIE